MSKNIIITISFFCFINTTLYAQQITIFGVVSNLDSSPTSYVLINFLSNDKIIQSTQTDSLGRYSTEVDLPTSIIKLEISNWGNILHKDSIVYGGEEHIVKNIQLQIENDIEINEVIVQAVRNGLSVKNNKLIYTPKEALLKSSNVFDVLKHTPMIDVKDNSISLLSKQGTQIYINGKQVHIPIESLIENLKTMPSDNLKNIEILTNPGSEYQASTTGGIINIVLKNNFDDGLWGQITSLDKQGDKNSQYISSNLLYRKRNFGIDGTVSLINNNSLIKSDNLVEMKDTGEGQYTVSSYRYKTKSINATINAEYELDKQHSFNLFSTLRLSKPNTFSDAYTSYYNVYTNIKSDTLNKTKATQADSKINSYFLNISYLYKINDKGQKLAISTDYMHYKYTQYQYTSIASLFENNIYPLQNIISHTPQKIKSYSLKADYALPFFDNILNLGVYYSYNQNETYYSETENNILNTSNKFLYDEYLTAGYIKLSRTWSDKFSTSVGVRVEHMKIKRDLQSIESNNWEEDKFNLFPSLNFNYVLNEHWSFNYSLSNKVERPAFWQLNPSKFYLNNNLYRIENPFLKNTYITSQELSFTLNNKYYLALGYNYLKDETSQFMMPDKEQNGANFYNRYNYGNRNNLALTLSLPFQFFSNFWSGNLTLVSVYDYYIYTDKNLRQYYINKGSFTEVFMINNTFTLSEKKQLWAFINISYATPFTEVYKRNTTKAPVIDFEIKKIWSNWTLSLKTDSLLGSKTKSTVLNNDVSPYLKNSFNQNSDKAIQLKVSYSFGNSKAKKNRQSQLANEETRNRVQ